MKDGSFLEQNPFSLENRLSENHYPFVSENGASRTSELLS